MPTSQDGILPKNTIPLFKVLMNKNVDQPLLKTIHSGWVGQGPRVDEFEEQLSNKFKNPYCLSVSSGTAGLSLALRLSNVYPGDEVISTPWTCNATSEIILLHGNIIWADIKEDLNIDPKSIKENITPKTKAIMVVHIGGYPCDMDEIYKISKHYDIPIIEDAAHSFGSTYKGNYIGECKHCNFSVMSFQAIKHLTCSDGGAVFCKEQKSYDRGKKLRWFGIDRTSTIIPRSAYPIEESGFKYHMSDVCATIGLSNLEIVDQSVSISRDNALYYEKELQNIPGLKLTQTKKDRLSTYWLFSILVENRSNFIKTMEEKKIEVSPVQHRNDYNPYAKKFKKELPMMDKLHDHIISIPCGFWVTKENREYIVNCIKQGW